MKSTAEIIGVLNNSHCSEYYHKYSSIPTFPVATDGVIALAEASGCYWLLDVIGSFQTNRKLDKSFQVWKLEVNLEKQCGVVRGFT